MWSNHSVEPLGPKIRSDRSIGLYKPFGRKNCRTTRSKKTVGPLGRKKTVGQFGRTTRSPHLGGKAQARVRPHLRVGPEPVQEASQQEVPVTVQVPPRLDHRRPPRSNIAKGEGLREPEGCEHRHLHVHVLNAVVPAGKESK